LGTTPHRTRRRLIPAVTATLAAAVLLSGCTNGSAPAAEPTDIFSLLVDAYLEDPVAENYSDEQIAILERARDAGELSFEEYAAAVSVALDCISDAGFHVQRDAPDDSRGFLTITYFYEGPEAGNPTAEACLLEHSAGVEAVYQLQPVSADAETALMAESMHDTIACLSEIGITEDFEGLSVDEFNARLGSLLLEAQEISGERARAIAACDSYGTG